MNIRNEEPMPLKSTHTPPSATALLAERRVSVVHLHWPLSSPHLQLTAILAVRQRTCRTAQDS